MRQTALAIVRQHDDVGPLEQAFEFTQLGRQHFVARRRLEIDAQQLLAATDHAQLHRGRQARIVV